MKVAVTSPAAVAVTWSDDTPEELMTTRLSDRAYAFAEGKIKDGKVQADQMDDWSEHQPSTRQENEFIEAHGWDEYALWHLGFDDEASEHTKGRYKYPYGDFTRVHRCGLLAAEVRAGRNKHRDIEDAAIRLREMLDGRDHPA